MRTVRGRLNGSNEAIKTLVQLRRCVMEAYDDATYSRYDGLQRNAINLMHSIGLVDYIPPITDADLRLSIYAASRAIESSVKKSTIDQEISALTKIWSPTSEKKGASGWLLKLVSRGIGNLAEDQDTARAEPIAFMEHLKALAVAWSVKKRLIEIAVVFCFTGMRWSTGKRLNWNSFRAVMKNGASVIVPSCRSQKEFELVAYQLKMGYILGFTFQVKTKTQRNATVYVPNFADVSHKFDRSGEFGVGPTLL